MRADRIIAQAAIVAAQKAKQIGPQAIKWQEKTEHKQEGKASTQDR